MRRYADWVRRYSSAAALVGGLIAIVVGVRLNRPVPTAGLGSRSRPAPGYDAAMLLLGRLQARDGPEVDPRSRTQASLHGRRTRRVVVLVHGLSSSPHMWRVLQAQLFERGDNVLMARLPHHGLSDRMTAELQKLTAEELVAHGDAVVDIAAGLGEEVVVVGISLGGVLAAWLAERRADVHTAVIVNPNFSAPHLRGAAARMLTNALRALPNLFLWWDIRTREKVAGPNYAYPRFSTRAVGEAFRLGQAVERAAGDRPAARRVVVMTTAADPAVSNAFTDGVVACWREAGATDIVTHRWRPDEIAAHDILSPDQPYQRVDLVYPRLLQLIDATE
jgi:carboxylesterase